MGWQFEMELRNGLSTFYTYILHYGIKLLNPGLIFHRNSMFDDKIT